MHSWSLGHNFLVSQSKLEHSYAGKVVFSFMSVIPASLAGSLQSRQVREETDKFISWWVVHPRRRTQVCPPIMFPGVQPPRSDDSPT